MDHSNITNEGTKEDRIFGLEARGLYLSTYRGVIVDNKDPEQLGRVKIRVPQVASDNVIDTWAWPKGQPCGEDFGDFYIPPKGSPVWVEFEQGKPSNPVWLGGHWAKKNGKTPNEGKLADPKNRVRKSEKWIMEMDDASDKFKITSKDGGHHYFLDGQGNFNMQIGKDHTLNMGGDKTETVSGDKSDSVSGDRSTTISGDRTENVSGDKHETVGQKRTINCDEFGLTANKGKFDFNGITFDMNTPNQLTISVGSSSIVISAGGVTIMGRDFLTHHHTGVVPGGGNTGNVL